MGAVESSVAAGRPAAAEPARVSVYEDERLKDFFREGELEALQRIVEKWSHEELSGFEARKTLMEQVLRGKTHVELSLQSAQSASTAAAERGARAGGDIGRNLASSLTAMVSETVTQVSRDTNMQPNASARHVGNAAAEAVGFLGMVAGSVVGGVGNAIQGSTQAGLQSREVFLFVDRTFLRATRPQAWELAAQTLGIEGTGPQLPVIEDKFRAKVHELLGVASGSTNSNARTSSQANKSGTWLRLVQLCLSFELLRHLPAPPHRQTLPNEHLLVQLRLDEEYLNNRVRELAEMVEQMSGTRKAPLSRQKINQCCPAEQLTATMEETCPICLEQLSAGEKVRKLPCGHIMHQECGDRWLQTAGTCPTCRGDVRS